MKNRFFGKITLILFLFALPFSLMAYDFGFVANINTGTNGTDGDDSNFIFRADLWPRFSALIGDNGEFIVSAGFSLGLDEEEDFYYVPELLHTEFTMRFGASAIRAGRFGYSDPMSLVADGLFDGVQFIHTSNIGFFRAGAWYTGFLYKKNANITMTSFDDEKFSEAIDYNDFANTYFATKRAFASIGWEHPSIGELLHLNTAVIAQMDLNDKDVKYNNQYFIFNMRIPVNMFVVELGGGLELSQITGDKDESGMAFAGAFGIHWLFPSEFNSRLSFIGKFASGKSEGSHEAFVPISTIYFGQVFNSKISGLTIAALNYSGRFTQTFSASATASYFIRNDLGTFQGYPASSDSDGYFLGPEFSARLVWAPFSDLQLSLGGGVFVPSLGDAGPKEKMQWHAALNVTMNLY